MTPTRTGIAALLLTTGLAVGCGGSNSSVPSPTGPGLPPGEPESRRPGSPAHSEAMAAAREFLDAANQGTPDPARVTPAFKKVVADPVTEADKAQGYSDWAVEQWLKNHLTGKVNTAGMTAADISPERVVVTAGLPPGGEFGRAVLRMVKVDGRWLVDWVHVAPPGSEVPLNGTGDQLARAFAASAFLDTALTGQRSLTEDVLTPAVKSRLAPPLGDPIGYNRGVLGVKVSNFRGEATGYKIDKLTADQVTGTLVGETTRPFTLKLVPGPKPGEWLVDDFQPN